MFKRFYILFLALIVASCTSPSIKSSGYFSDKAVLWQIDEESFVTPESFRVGVLLPLSGEAGKFGQGLKQATMLALEDMNNDNLILQFYDTQGTPEGARMAAENALNQGVKLIIGPLMSTEVEAISYQTRRRDVPVVAFSTDEKVLQAQVYTLGLLIDEQVDRIIGYAAKAQGRSRFALLLPDNSSGTAVAKSAVKAAKKYGGTVVRIAFYAPNTTDFSEIVRELTDFDKRSEPLKKQKDQLKALVQKGDKDAAAALRRLNLKDADDGVDFDAVIIPESGSRLKSAAAMFGYYDVFSPEVMFLGTSVWENTGLNKETTLVKAAYPRLSRTHNAYFNKKFQSLFGTYPNGLYAFAYDAVALSSALSKRNSSDLDAAITHPDGFAGINGIFRFFPNGKNQHSLDIIEITPSADKVVDAASHKFSADTQQDYSPYDGDIAADYDNTPPMIFGKDVGEAQRAVFGRQLGFGYNDSGTGFFY